LGDAPGRAGLLYGQGEFVTKHHALVLGGRFDGPDDAHDAPLGGALAVEQHRMGLDHGAARGLFHHRRHRSISTARPSASAAPCAEGATDSSNGRPPDAGSLPSRAWRVPDRRRCAPAGG
jgi:hypothetical protein